MQLGLNSKVGTVLKSWGPVDFKNVLGDLSMWKLRWDIGINANALFFFGTPCMNEKFVMCPLVS